MKTSLRPAFLMAIVAMCTIPPAADAESQNLSGRWEATFMFDTPITGVLELTHQGDTVTGRLNTGFTGGDMPVEGGYADGKLMLSGSTTSGPHPGMQLDFTAALESDNKMKGMLSWQVGDFPWTAERIK